ncbi:MAG: hypothetical protein WA973_14900 [Mesorhizobium sp.]
MLKLLDAATGGYARLILYGLAALAIVAAFGYTYHAGYSRAAATWEAKYELREAAIRKATADEITRQAQANAQAKAIEADRIRRLAEENAALEEKIKELSDEADADPDRDNTCLSDGSRVRIDSIH